MPITRSKHPIKTNRHQRTQTQTPQLSQQQERGKTRIWRHSKRSLRKNEENGNAAQG